MAEIVLFDPDVHLDEFKRLCIEHFTWIKEQDLLNQIDIASTLGLTAAQARVRFQQTVEELSSPYVQIKPSEGALFILDVDGEVAGMGAMRKLGGNRGVINLMYNRPRFRGNGYGKQMLDRLMEAGRELGVSIFQLITPTFSHVAHHIYRSAGFVERDEYPESLMPSILPILVPARIYMEKKE
jgi:GNAT superfamily N-acetyltransferase